MISKINAWLDKKLVEDWREAYKWASVKAAGAFGAAVTALALNTDVLMSVVSFMPADPIQRFIAATAVGLVAAFAPTIVRVWDQSKTNDPDQS